jgi:hypothetical protein
MTEAFRKTEIFASLVLILLVFESCGQTSGEIAYGDSRGLYHDTGRTVSSRFDVPDGFKRIEEKRGTFGDYLRSLPLKPHGAVVHLYNGRLKSSQEVHAAVLDMDVGTGDLQQCADAVMRLRGEYLYKTKQYDKIHFNLTNGFRVDYSQWMKGNRVEVNGNKTTWVPKKAPSNTYSDFREYMYFIFTYAGTLSLSRELKPVRMEDIKPGDVFIRGGSPGHAVMVIDVAGNLETGEELFLIAQSYMPAQEIHILRNPENSALFPWYSTNFKGDLVTPEWTFSRDELMRFGE